MTNLTVTVDEYVLRQARIRALEEGTSVNAIVASCLEAYSGWRERQAAATAGFLAATEHLSAESLENARARGGRTWRREDLYDR